jgi:predicted MFS family arabinose efflux permease
MSRLDPRGRISSAGPTFIKIGYSVGAPVGGLVMEAAGRRALGGFAAAWIVLGMALYCAMAARSERTL